MKLASALSIAALTLAAGPEATPPVPNDEAAVAHALHRLAFGPRPADVARARALGLSHWIDQQLQPAQIPDGPLDVRLARLETRDEFLPERQQRLAQHAAGDLAPTAPQAMPRVIDATITRQRRILSELAEAKLLRAVYSERQLEEVLVDFWFNHFNVFARKGQTSMHVGEYEREAIRPHVFGRFRDMLGATAASPAMLIYLDNWQSAAPTVGQGRVANPPPGNRPPRGLNENYARELLELHTLGVDGGYTQNDVVNVARALTGWTITRPGKGGFRFAPNRHDREAKTVLGQTIPAGGGKDDGERVLDILARHPATARHIAFKLAQRLVSDTPPRALVDRAAATFRASDGHLREVVRAIVTSPEFFDPGVYFAKVKTPFEFVVSALRAAEVEVRGGQAVLQVLADMGMPLYLCQPPTGYDDTADAWISSGALITRINFALRLTRGQIRGVHLPAHVRADALALGSAEFQKQ